MHQNNSLIAELTVTFYFQQNDDCLYDFVGVSLVIVFNINNTCNSPQYCRISDKIIRRFIQLTTYIDIISIIFNLSADLLKLEENHLT